MTGPLSSRSDAELELALRDLGLAVATPPTLAADVALNVRRRLETATIPAAGRGAVRLFGRPVRLSLGLAVASALLIAALAAALNFGLPGLRIVIEGPPSAGPGSPTPSTPAPTVAPVELSQLGRRVDLARLDAEAGFHVALPSTPPPGTFVGAYVLEIDGLTVVNLAYAAPSAPSGTATVLISEFRASLTTDLVKKVAEPDTTVDFVTVRGSTGFWISGAPHELLFLDPSGEVRSDTIRLVGNVLAWSRDGVTFRIEGVGDLTSAMAIAISLR